MKHYGIFAFAAKKHKALAASNGGKKKTMPMNYTPYVTGFNVVVRCMTLAAKKSTRREITRRMAAQLFNINLILEGMSIGLPTTGARKHTTKVRRTVPHHKRFKAVKQAILVLQTASLDANHPLQVPSDMPIVPAETWVLSCEMDRNGAEAVSQLGRLSYFCVTVLGRTPTIGKLSYLTREVQPHEGPTALRAKLGAGKSVLEAYTLWHLMERKKLASDDKAVKRRFSESMAKSGYKGASLHDTEITVKTDPLGDSTRFNLSIVLRQIAATDINLVDRRMERIRLNMDTAWARMRNDREGTEVLGVPSLTSTGHIARYTELKEELEHLRSIQKACAEQAAATACALSSAAHSQATRSKRERCSLTAKTAKHRYTDLGNAVRTLMEWRTELQARIVKQKAAKAITTYLISDVGEWLLLSCYLLMPPVSNCAHSYRVLTAEPQVRREIDLQTTIHHVSVVAVDGVATYSLAMPDLFKTSVSSNITERYMRAEMTDFMEFYMENRVALVPKGVCCCWLNSPHTHQQLSCSG